MAPWMDGRTSWYKKENGLRGQFGWKETRIDSTKDAIRLLNVPSANTSAQNRLEAYMNNIVEVLSSFTSRPIPPFFENESNFKEKNWFYSELKLSLTTLKTIHSVLLYTYRWGITNVDTRWIKNGLKTTTRTITSPFYSFDRRKQSLDLSIPCRH